MKNLNKKLVALTLILTMAAAFGLAGCGDKGGENGALSEKDYVAKVKELSDKAESVTTEKMAGISQTDQAAYIAALKDVINEAKPIFEELGALKAPEKYADQQAKIKEGSDASVELLDLSLEMLEMATDPNVNQADAQKKLTELQSKMADLTAMVQEYETALSDVLADAK